MKKKILTITLVFILAGTVVLGFDIINLTPDEAYETALENDLQRDIDELNNELKQISLDKSIRNASYTAVNSYQGMITKYVLPYDAATNLHVSEMNIEKSKKQLEVTVLSAVITLEESRISYNDSKKSYEEALAEYNKAKTDVTVPNAELLSLEYSAENNRIKMVQAENNFNKRKTELNSLLGIDDAVVEIPAEYNSPYTIDENKAYESALAVDISIYQSERLLESAGMRHEIAADFFGEEDETYISTLAALKSAELNHSLKLASLELSVLDKIDSLKNLYDSIQLEDLNVKIKEELYNASLKQYEAGVVSVKSLESAEYAFEFAKSQRNSKINDYIIASKQFAIDTGLAF